MHNLLEVLEHTFCRAGELIKKDSSFEYSESLRKFDTFLPGNYVTMFCFSREGTLY